ncbi:hypothetical protein [Clostridium butyricum]|uniref:hypothetical protein n=1 Tax=Clostridium butyricum TaxID=1492 RepID=UPI00325A4F6A
MDSIVIPKELDKFDIEILYVLLINQKTTKLQSFKIADIMNNTELKSAYYTFVNRIKNKLIPTGYVGLGFKDGNANTYYISDAGIDFLNNNVLNKENLYEEDEED